MACTMAVKLLPVSTTTSAWAMWWMISSRVALPTKVTLSRRVSDCIVVLLDDVFNVRPRIERVRKRAVCCGTDVWSNDARPKVERVPVACRGIGAAVSLLKVQRLDLHRVFHGIVAAHGGWYGTRMRPLSGGARAQSAS